VVARISDLPSLNYADFLKRVLSSESAMLFLGNSGLNLNYTSTGVLSQNPTGEVNKSANPLIKLRTSYFDTNLINISNSNTAKI
jgi:hypothetical protein